MASNTPFLLPRRQCTGPLFSPLILSGCSATQVLQPPERGGQDQALVYFIRKTYPPYLREVRLHVNGRLAATIANNDFVAVSLPIGSSTILLEDNDGKPLSFQMQVERAADVFVVLTGDLWKTGHEFTGYNTITVHTGWNLRAYRVGQPEAEAVAAGFGRRLP